MKTKITNVCFENMFSKLLPSYFVEPTRYLQSDETLPLAE